MMGDWITPYRDITNSYWPLPRDYDTLSSDGQKLARLSVLTDHSTPLKFVISWDFFRRIYLAQTENVVFYKKGFSLSPPFHYNLVFDMGMHGRNVTAAPRGSAKSTVLTEVAMLLALTKPPYETMFGLATDKLVEERFDQIMFQFQDNELILQDFGEMRPKRGSALWNHHYLHLSNGSVIKGLSVMGKKRGGRPHLFILDDPENDPDSDSESSRSILIEKFEMILFKQILPMLESGSCVSWVGTLIDRKAFLYKAVKGDDPRFDFWNRKTLRAITYDKDDPSKCHVLWPAKWPQDVLEARKEEIGLSAFHSEYLNEPVSAQDRILIVDPRRNEYTVDGSFNWTNPLSNGNLVHWNDRVFGEDSTGRIYLERTAPYHELVRPMFRFLLFDYAEGLTSYNDYSCIAICGMDTQATLWVLQMLLMRAKEDTLMRLIYETGLSWQVRVIGIEAVSIQKAFCEATREYTLEQGNMRGDQWRARVFPITYPARESKAQKIASLEWRFNSGRIKYPAHMKNEWPYNQLYDQTQDFTMDLALLPHDDAIDTLSMSKYVIKTTGHQFKREAGQSGLLERIIKNQPAIPGQPLLSGVSSSQISDEMMGILSRRARDKAVEPRRRRIERRNPRNIR